MCANHSDALVYDHVSFSYPEPGVGTGMSRSLPSAASPVLADVSFSIPTGAFALLCGSTGSGKTTLLRLAKHEIAPVGTVAGSIRVFDRPANAHDRSASAQTVGYVFQNPDNQIVCDTVWHELAFGLENLGTERGIMRRRISEVCLYLGIEPLYRRRCEELSGGERQIVALAAVLALRPRLLLLDEPCAMLDPVAAKEFIGLLFRINRELGITVVVATHNPAPLKPYATCALLLRDGKVEAAGLAELDAADTLPDPLARPREDGRLVLAAHGLWYRYARASHWILRDCGLTLAPGEVRALVGGNGSGKSTLLLLCAGSLRPRVGRVRRSKDLHTALLPQDPRMLFGCATVAEELGEWSRAYGYGAAEIDDVLGRIGLLERRDTSPFDLSGGQQELLALEKLLLTHPDVLFLDEPTKGLDAAARRRAAERIQQLSRSGAAVLVATHDMAFVRSCAQAVSLLFDGQLAEPEDTEAFLHDSWMWNV